MFCMFPRRLGMTPVIASIFAVIGVMRWICQSKRCTLGDQVHVTSTRDGLRYIESIFVDDAVQVLSSTVT